MLTHTRWHRDDLAGRLLKKMADRAADQWEVLCLPAVKEAVAGSGEQGVVGWDKRSDAGPPSKSANGVCRVGQAPAPAEPARPVLASSLVPPYVCIADIRQPGDALWPEFKSAADLELIRQQDARAFAALYQQDPAEATLCRMAGGILRRLDVAAGGAGRGTSSTALSAWTPARATRTSRAITRRSSSSASARTGCCTLTPSSTVFPWTRSSAARSPFATTTCPDHVGIEAEQFQELLVHEFRRHCGDFQRRWSVWMMKTAGVPKVARIRRLTHYINAASFASGRIRPAAGGWSISSWTFRWRSTTTARTRGDVYAVAGGIEAVEVEAG